MIELVNVSKYYTSNGVTNKGLINVNLTLNKGEIVAITGESGSGKSTLLNVITKVDAFDEGEVYYKGNETSYFSIDDMDQFRKDKIGFIFQNYNIIDSYTVLENVMLPLIINGSSRNEAKTEAMAILEKVGLTARMKNRGSQLSGGEKQRCVIARALASKCEILACDEPTGNLDSKTGEEIIKLLKEVASDKLVLIVTHNFEQVEGIATRKIKLDDGQIVEDLFIDKSTKELEDLKEELDLDYKPITKKTNFRISLNNLISTPKKTFLIGLILLFTSIIVLYLYQGISLSFENSTDNGQLAYRGNNKIVASNLNHKAFDKKELEDSGLTYYTNEFYYNLSKSIIMGTWQTELINFSAYYEPNPKDYKIIYGSKPEKSDECMFLVNESAYSKSELKDMCDNEFSFSDSNLIGDKYYITGVAYCNSVNYDSVVITGNEIIHTLYKTLGIIEMTNSYGTYAFTRPKISIDLSTTTKYLLRDSLGGDKLFYYDNVMFDFTDRIERVDNQESEVIIGYDFFSSMDDYEVTCYGSKKKARSFLKDYDVYIIDCKTYTTMTKFEIAISHLTEYLVIVGTTLVLIIVYFIAYAILAVIFKSKSESYNIFRTLGVTRNDMKYIVIFETMISIVTISILAYAIARITALFVDNVYVSIFKNISFAITLLYFAVMFILGLLLGKRFNRRLFHFTVREGLKQVK